MKKLSLLLLATFALFSCASSNKSPTQVYLKKAKQWSFQHQVAHYKWNNPKRVPANKKSTNPALEELITKVRANPQFLQAPIGVLAKHEGSGVNEDGQEWSYTSE
jgi:hypothetical protein